MAVVQSDKVVSISLLILNFFPLSERHQHLHADSQAVALQLLRERERREGREHRRAAAGLPRSRPGEDVNILCCTKDMHGILTFRYTYFLAELRSRGKPDYGSPRRRLGRRVLC